jgi:hypothetical protein
LSRQATLALKPQRSVSGEGMAMREVLNPTINYIRKDGSKNSRSSSASSKGAGGGPLTSLSMQQILQPYIALNLIEKKQMGKSLNKRNYYKVNFDKLKSMIDQIWAVINQKNEKHNNHPLERNI